MVAHREARPETESARHLRGSEPLREPGFQVFAQMFRIDSAYRRDEGLQPFAFMRAHGADSGVGNPRMRLDNRANKPGIDVDAANLHGAVARRTGTRRWSSSQHTISGICKTCGPCRNPWRSAPHPASSNKAEAESLGRRLRASRSRRFRSSRKSRPAGPSHFPARPVPRRAGRALPNLRR